MGPDSRRQRELFREADGIARLTQLNYRMIEEADPDARIPLLRNAINKMIVAEMVTRYTLLDEILSDLIARYFFKQPKNLLHFGKLWRTKKFETFTHHVLDEMYLLKKMELVHAIDPLPSQTTKTIRRVNALRNAFAHSFFPENRKEHRKNKKVLYSGKDIRTAEGLELFLNDWHPTWTYLARRAYGQRYNDEE